MNNCFITGLMLSRLETYWSMNPEDFARWPFPGHVDEQLLNLPIKVYVTPRIHHVYARSVLFRSNVIVSRFMMVFAVHTLLCMLHKKPGVQEENNLKLVG